MPPVVAVVKAQLTRALARFSGREQSPRAMAAFDRLDDAFLLAGRGIDRKAYSLANASVLFMAQLAGQKAR